MKNEKQQNWPPAENAGRSSQFLSADCRGLQNKEIVKTQKIATMSETTWDEKRNGHIVRYGKRSEAPYRFIGKTKHCFLPAAVTTKVGGITTALQMVRDGYEIGQEIL